MRILVTNGSGKIGKSLIARDVLYANMPNALLIEIESFNTGSSNFQGVECHKIAPGELLKSDLFSEILIRENVIIDVGSSEVSGFFEEIAQYDGFLDEIDLFVLPCRSGSSAVAQDTAQMLYYLIKEEKIDPKKIRVLINMAGKNIEAENEFLIDSIKTLKLNYKIDFDCFLSSFKVVDQLIKAKLTAKEVVEDTTDYQDLHLKHHEDPELKLLYAGKILMQKMARAYFNECKRTFDVLNEG